MYKRENKCGRAPEDAKVLLDRLTPPARAVAAQSVTDTAAEPPTPLNVNTNTVIMQSDATPKGNPKCPIAIYQKEDSSAITDSSARGFISALDLLEKAETEGFDMLKFLREISKNKGTPLQNQPMPPPVVINTPAPSRDIAFHRWERNGEATTTPLQKIGPILDSIREDNYVEGSLFSSVASEASDSPAKRLFTSLEEVDYTLFDHADACVDLLRAINGYFFNHVLYSSPNTCTT
eukprot:scaffold56907_cov38-Cyclotella_meneghiniana.AAC.3